MVTGLFGSLLREISQTLKIAELQPDEHNTCLLRFANGIEMFIQMDKTEKNLILCINLGQPPLGRYRENLFRAALAANALKYPRYGTFAFSAQANALVLFKQFPVNELRGELVAEFMPFFVQKAHIWREALSRSEVPIVTQPSSSLAAPSGLLGLR